MMNDSTPYDRARAWIQEELPHDQLDRIERELAADPDLAAFAQEYRDVFMLTSAADKELPVSALGFEELALPRITVPRRVAAAILLLAAASSSVWLAMTGADPAPRPRVALDSIRLPDSIVPEEVEPRPIPAVLATYRSVEEGEIRWFSDLGDARATAEAAGRPVLVFGTLPGCPWCATIRRDALRDQGVLELCDRVVPIELDLSAMDQDEASRWMRRGYPLLEVQDAEGNTLVGFSGAVPSVKEFFDNLSEGLALSSADSLDWDVVQQLAGEYTAGRRAEQERRFGAAYLAFARLARGGREGWFEAGGRAGMARVARVARDAVRRAEATGSRASAEEVLVEAIDRLVGTPYAADLARVLDQLRATGTFPALTGSGD